MGKINSGTQVLNRKAYLYMTVRNRCLDQLRKKGLHFESPARVLAGLGD